MQPTEFAGAASYLLWSIFIVCALGAGIFGLIFSYHWMRFSSAPVITFFSIITYACGALLLLGVMLGAILSL